MKTKIKSLRSRIEIEHSREISRNVFFIGIANQEYLLPDMVLQFPHKDVKDISESLQKSFPSDYLFHEYLMLDSPDISDISENLAKISEKAELNDIVILYLAGHGAIIPEDQFQYRYLLSSFKPDEPLENSILMSDFYDFFTVINSIEKIMFIDTCQSGVVLDWKSPMANDFSIRNSRGLGVLRTPESQNLISDISNKSMRFIYSEIYHQSGVTIFSSSRADQLSFESSKFQNGLFSESLLNAMSTSKTDLDDDNQISMSELGLEVSNMVNDWTGNTQSPNFLKINPYAKFKLKSP